MRVRAQLRYLHSPDIADLENDLPDDDQIFGFLVQAMIGPDKGDGEESFDFMVCTPRWLETQMGYDDYRLGRHYLFVKSYSYGVVWRAITHVCDLAQGENWDEVAQRINQYGRWEFEDYSA